MLTQTGPIRTCIGCRKREEQNQMVRLALDPQAVPRTVVVDLRRRLPGRGAWLHPSTDCLQSAVSRRAFARAFRGPVETSELADSLQQAPTDHAGAPPASGAHHHSTNEESGSVT